MQGTSGGSRIGTTTIRPASIGIVRGTNNSTLTATGLNTFGIDLATGINSSNSGQFTIIASDGAGTDNELNLYADLTGIALRDWDNTISDYTAFLTLGPNDGVTIPPVKFQREVDFTTGADKQAGTATLNGGNPGTVTISNALVTANSIIMLTKQTNTNTNAGPVVVSSKGTGTFTITSNHNGDADVVGWFIINPS